MSVMPDQEQPCIGCGRGTNAGTPLFSDRRTTSDPSGGSIHLCGDCNERASRSLRAAPTDADMRRIAARSSSFGIY